MIKKLFKIIFLCLILFCFFLYQQVKTKSKNISNETPFKALVGKTVLLNQNTLLFQELIPINKKYPYLLLDSLHPYLQMQDTTTANTDLKLIKEIKAGATLTFERATVYTNGVSGGSQPYLMGTLKDVNNTYKIVYQWGERSFEKHFNGVAESWKFNQAPWQKQPDTNFYALPEARWW